MIEGILMAEKILKNPDFLDYVKGQGFVIDRNTIDRIFDHSCSFVVDHQLGQIESDSHFQHPQPVYHVGPCQRR